MRCEVWNAKTHGISLTWEAFPNRWVNALSYNASSTEIRIYSSASCGCQICVIHVPWDQSDSVYVQTFFNKQKTLTNRLICRLIVTPNDQGTQVSAPPKAPHTSTSMAWTASSSYIISAPRDGHSSLRDPQRCQNECPKVPTEICDEENLVVNQFHIDLCKHDNINLHSVSNCQTVTSLSFSLSGAWSWSFSRCGPKGGLAANCPFFVAVSIFLQAGSRQQYPEAKWNESIYVVVKFCQNGDFVGA